MGLITVLCMHGSGKRYGVVESESIYNRYNSFHYFEENNQN